MTCFSGLASSIPLKTDTLAQKRSHNCKIALSMFDRMAEKFGSYYVRHPEHETFYIMSTRRDRSFPALNVNPTDAKIPRIAIKFNTGTSSCYTEVAMADYPQVLNHLAEMAELLPALILQHRG